MSFGIRELLVVLVIVLLLFGTRKLATLGSDLGAAIKGFRKSMGDDAPASETGEPESEVSQKAGAESVPRRQLSDAG